MRTSTLLLLATLFYSLSAQPLMPVADFWQTDGDIYDMTLISDTLFIAGEFNYVGPQIPHGAIVDEVFGDLRPAFPLIDGMVRAAIPDESGGWYIAGQFETIGGLPIRNLAHVDAMGAVDASFQPNPNGWIASLLLHRDTLYIGGAFTELANLPRKNLAAYDLLNNQPTSLSPQVDLTVWVMVAHNQELFIGGMFQTIEGQNRSVLASFDMASESLSSFQFNIQAPGTARIFAMTVHNDMLYVGGWFSSIDGQLRKTLAAFDLINRTLSSWNPSTIHFVYDVEAVGDTLFIAGDFEIVNGVGRKFLAALDIPTGALIPWDPQLDRFPQMGAQVSSLDRFGNTLYVGGAFAKAGDSTRLNFAALDIPSLIYTAWTPKSDGMVNALSHSGNQVFVGGSFQSVGGAYRQHIAALNVMTGEALDWNVPVENTHPNTRVSAIATDGSTLYVGGFFDQIKGQSRFNLASINIPTQSLTHWNPEAVLNTPTGFVNDILLSDTRIYIGGFFSTVFGQNRMSLAAFDRSTGQLETWEPNPDRVMNTLTLGPSRLFVGGDFEIIDGLPRDGLAAFDLSTGILDDWNPQLSGTSPFPTGGGPTGAGNVRPEVRALRYDNGSLFIGGNIDSVNHIPRKFLAAFDTSQDTLTDWNPQANNSVEIITTKADRLFVGGAFDTLNSQSRSKIGLYNRSNEELLAISPPEINGEVYSLISEGDRLYVGGGFSFVEGVYRPGLAVFQHDAITAVDPLPIVNPLLATVYPNPNSGTLYIAFRESITGNMQIQINDLTGRVRLQQNPIIQPGQILELDVSLLALGIYLLQIGEGANRETHKILIQR